MAAKSIARAVLFRVASEPHQLQSSGNGQIILASSLVAVATCSHGGGMRREVCTFEGGPLGRVAAQRHDLQVGSFGGDARTVAFAAVDLLVLRRRVESKAGEKKKE